MDVDSTTASNVDNWLACFTSPTPGTFPFTSHKIQSIESRRARMSDLLIFDVLLIRGGIRNPDVLFPPADWTALRLLLDAIDESVYDILKKDCLVYILLKWAWDIDTRENNPGWDARYTQDRCIPPQFATLAHAYWLLDTGTHLAKAVSILSDARLNRDYVSKILQALALSSSFAGGTSPATAALVVKYVRTAKPLLTEPDDIDLYALSLAQLSFMDAWAYQKSFPEESETRERLLRKLVGWCLMPTPRQQPLAHLLAFPLPPYEQSFLRTLALPSSSASLSGLNTHTIATSSGPVLSSQAISILQDLLCVRAIQSGNYVCAIKLDREFSSVSPTLGSGPSSSNIASQAPSSVRDAIDRKSIIQDLFTTLPPAERTLLEDEIGKVATGVRANAPSTPRHGASAATRPLMAEMSLSASWEDVGAGMASPAPSTLSRGKATPASVSTNSKATQSPFVQHLPRGQPVFSHQAPPTPKFTAFGSPIPSTTGVNMGRGVITERGRTLFSTSAPGGPNASAKPATRLSLFDTAGSAKNAPNAFYKPPSAPSQTARVSLDVESALGGPRANGATRGANAGNQNGKTIQVESDGEDVSMGSRSDVEITGEERDEDDAANQDEDEDEHFITHDKSADLTLQHDVDLGMVEEDGVGLDFGFSVFSERSVAQNGNTGGRKGNENEHVFPDSPPPRARASPIREEDKSLNTSVNSTATGRWQVPPGAFHHEEDDEDRHDRKENRDKVDSGEEDDRASETTPIHSRRESVRARMQTQTPPRPSALSQPQGSPNYTITITDRTSGPSVHTRRTSSSRTWPSQTIPGALMDDDNDEHGQNETDHGDMHGDEDTEMDEDDAIAPLPSRSSRRTRSSGLVDASTTKLKTTAKSTGPANMPSTTTVKGKAKARPSEVKTPARRSSRLSMASSLSPDNTEAVSPTKKGRKSAAPRASITGNGTVTTRSSTRRKR